jgi:hypothetical protein
MKSIRPLFVRMLLSVLLVPVVSRHSHAQCTDLLEPQVYQCEFEECRNRVTVEYPDMAGDDHGYDCFSVECCGQLFTSCEYVDNDDCGGDSADPAKRERIAQMAEGSRILVADCKGRYRLFRDTTDASHFHKFLVLTDHVLR